MTKSIKQIAVSVLFTLSILQIIFAQTAPAKDIGINLSEMSYYSPEIIFKDAFKQSVGEKWLTTNASGSGAWNTNLQFPKTADGYPTKVPFIVTTGTVVSAPQIVHGQMFYGINGAYPAGIYTLLADGKGKINLKGDLVGADVIYNFPSTTGITFTISVPGNQGLEIRLTSSDSLNPIHNIRIILPGFINSYLSAPFYPTFISLLDNFSTIRFMHVAGIIGSSTVNWSQRRLPGSFTQVGVMAYEYMAKLCNIANKNCWLNIPHKADNNYIIQTAQFFRDSLNPNLKIYLEYSNECWNTSPQYTESVYCQDQGIALGFASANQKAAAGRRFYAHRAAYIFHVFDSVFASTASQRLVKTIAWQASTSSNCNTLLTEFENPAYNWNSATADALAIAPYFGGPIADSIGDAGAINTITVQQILQSLQAQVSISESFMAANKAVANNHHVRLITYEGGQSLRAVNPTYVSNATLTSKLIAANHDSTMEAIYCSYFDAWYNHSTDLNMLTSACYEPGQYGMWGIVENLTQPFTDWPKYRAVANCVFAGTASCAVPTGLITTSVTVNNALLSWSVSSSAIRYNGRYKPTSLSTWTSFTTTVTSYSLTGLTASTSYEFQAESVCSSSASSGYSLSANFTTSSATGCGVPAGLTTTSITATSATVGWNVLSGVANYNIKYKAVDSSTWIISTANSNSLFISGLLEDTGYDFKVQSVCTSATDTSMYSSSSDFITDISSTAICGVPTGLLTSSVTATEATVNWNSPTGATSYNILYKLTSSSVWLSSTATGNLKSLAGLIADTSYDFKVQSVCTSGTDTSDYSSAVSFTTSAAPLGISNAENQIHATIYPNPSNGSVFIEYNLSGNENGFIHITDISGRIISTNLLEAGNHTKELKLDFLNEGFYFCRIIDGSGTIAVNKIMVLK